MYLVILCAIVAVAVTVWLIMAGEGKSPESRRSNARIQLAVPVEVECFGEVFNAASQDISRGGMLLKAKAPVKVAQPVHLSFTLPETTLVEIPAVVCHQRGELFGVKFDPTHRRRAVIEKWVRHAFEEDHRRAAKAAVQQPAEP
ncbi:MAG: PilZ domain-containing protein [Acidobacteriia bacterium]|nr:PilZ domain-containing protein [Terriglobia bacterium]